MPVGNFFKVNVGYVIVNTVFLYIIYGKIYNSL